MKQTDPHILNQQAIAINAWWRQYGRRWSAVHLLCEQRGWTPEDVLAEVQLSGLTKSAKNSGWDPSRQNIDAWAGLIGRSRVKHLLQRKYDQPVSFRREDGSEIEPEPTPWAPSSNGKIGEPVLIDEIRFELGLGPVSKAESVRDRAEATGDQDFLDFMDLFSPE